MLKALNELFERAFAGAGSPAAETAQRREHALQVATALLLIEVARADFRDDVTENEVLFGLLREFFRLSDEEAKLLVEEARRQADHAVELQAFTRRLHEQLTEAEKHRVIEMLWKVALADQHLDKHEDHLIRRIADLLYVPHRDLIRIRNRVHLPQL